MLDVHGKLISVGIPDNDFPAMTPFSLVSNGCFFGGSHIGSKKEALQMLDIAAKKGVKPWYVSKLLRGSTQLTMDVPGLKSFQ